MAIREALDRLYPPSPAFTEANVPVLTGKVFLVTGGNAGVGLELVKILYSKGGTVFIACRSQSKANEAIASIQAIPTPTPGQLSHLALDLSDLSSVKSAATTFLSRSPRLDVLFNNAGISTPPVGSKTAQGHELIMGTNCLGPFLLTSLLLPLLLRTADTDAAAQASVRIVWASSGTNESFVCPPGGVVLADLEPPFPSDQIRNYAMSKAGGWLLGAEFARRIKARAADGRRGGKGNEVVSLVVNPGNLRTKIWDSSPWYVRLGAQITLHDPKLGAYTELWAGLSEEVRMEDGGRYAIPWGRWHRSPREDIVAGLKGEEEGGTGTARKFWEWCEEQSKEYL